MGAFPQSGCRGGRATAVRVLARAAELTESSLSPPKHKYLNEGGNSSVSFWPPPWATEQLSISFRESNRWIYCTKPWRIHRLSRQGRLYSINKKTHNLGEMKGSAASSHCLVKENKHCWFLFTQCCPIFSVSEIFGRPIISRPGNKFLFLR